MNWDDEDPEHRFGYELATMVVWFGGILLVMFLAILIGKLA